MSSTSSCQKGVRIQKKVSLYVTLKKWKISLRIMNALHQPGNFITIEMQRITFISKGFAMNMFKAVKEETVESYLENVPTERSETVLFLHKFIQKAAPTLKPHFASNMLGYGVMKCLNHKKQEIEWPVVAMANQKQYISIYICATFNGQYIAEEWKEKLGKVSVGKSCIRFKKLEDVDLKGLEAVLKLAEKHPGYGTVEERKAVKEKQTTKKEAKKAAS